MKKKITDGLMAFMLHFSLWCLSMILISLPFVEVSGGSGEHFTSIPEPPIIYWIVGGFLCHFIWGLLWLNHKADRKRKINWLMQYLPNSALVLNENRNDYYHSHWSMKETVYPIDGTTSFNIREGGNGDKLCFYFNNVNDGFIILDINKREVYLSDSMKIVEQKMSIKEILTTKVDKKLLELLELDIQHDLALIDNREFDNNLQAEKAMRLLGI